MSITEKSRDIHVLIQIEAICILCHKNENIQKGLSDGDESAADSLMKKNCFNDVVIKIDFKFNGLPDEVLFCGWMQVSWVNEDFYKCLLFFRSRS